MQMSKNTIVNQVKKEGRKYLTEVESKQVLEQMGVDTTQVVLAGSKDEAVAASEKIGFPIVMKVVSPDILHKSDIGGVKLNLETAEDVGRAYDEIMTAVEEKQAGANVEGVAVQNMVESGLEVIIGMSQDPQFGPVLMFGLGGVFVEVIKDVSFRLVPLERRDAAEMIREIKGYPLLEGYRGSDPVSITALEDILLKLSAFVEENSDVKEVDLNPILAMKDGAVAVDARIILE